MLTLGNIVIVNDESKKKVCSCCRRMLASGVCIACGAATVFAAPVFHRIDPASGSRTAMFKQLTASELQISEPYTAADDRCDPLHTESTTGLRTDADLVTMGSVSTADLLWPPKYVRFPGL